MRFNLLSKGQQAERLEQQYNRHKWCVDTDTTMVIYRFVFIKKLWNEQQQCDQIRVLEYCPIVYKYKSMMFRRTIEQRLKRTVFRNLDYYHKIVFDTRKFSWSEDRRIMFYWSPVRWWDTNSNEDSPMVHRIESL